MMASNAHAVVRPGAVATLAICYITYAFSQFDLALFAYAVPAIRADFGVSLQTIGLVITIAYVVGGILQVMMGHLTDTFGRKRLLMVASGASSIFVALHALAIGPLTLALARAGAIGTGGAIYPATGAVVAEEAPARHRGMYAGALQTAYPLGWFLLRFAPRRCSLIMGGGPCSSWRCCRCRSCW
jgi:MFS family permease